MKIYTVKKRFHGSFAGKMRVVFRHFNKLLFLACVLLLHSIEKRISKYVPNGSICMSVCVSPEKTLTAAVSRDGIVEQAKPGRVSPALSKFVRMDHCDPDGSISTRNLCRIRRRRRAGEG